MIRVSREGCCGLAQRRTLQERPLQERTWQRRISQRRVSQRSGFTLLEMMLALALIVVVTSLVGSLIQMYAQNFSSKGDDIRRLQLARSLLAMIADDVRSVVTEQEYDASVLEAMMGSSGGGGGATSGTETSGASTGGAPTSGTTSGGPTGSSGSSTSAGGRSTTSGASSSGGSGAGSSGTSSSGTSTSSSSSTSDSQSGATGELSDTVTTAIAPGLYGTQYQLMVDVSRVPRPDQYIVEQGAAINPSLTDVPGDMKTVTYFVQSPTNQGVMDTMASFDPNGVGTGFSSGLVRRELDRAVTAYAEEMGDTDRLLRTGDLVAPEVLALEFSYFDGTQWLTEWDSSTQSLPWLIQISLAMQSATGSEISQLQPGMVISTMTLEDRRQYGIEVYDLTVAIPGAQLKAVDAAAADADSGMSSMGL